MPKQVQLSDEAYATLRALRRPTESFSDAVRRLATAGKDLGALRGLGPRLPGWDDAAMHQKGSEADRKVLTSLLGRGRRRGR